jgi:predicted LPLAT superfamily acyltransferase
MEETGVAQHWTERPEGGGWFAIWLIRTIGLKLGRQVARSILYPITLYFYFRRPYERRVSRAFLARVRGRSVNAFEVMAHIHRFASTILDRVFLLSDSFARFDVRIHGLSELVDPVRSGQGVLLLGSHVGSFEVLRVAAKKTPDVRVCVVLDRQQTPALTQLLGAINPEFEEGIIDASGAGTDIVLALREAIDNGKVAALLADRARPNEKTIAVDFLGAPAAFPMAPFRIAAILECPIVLCFGMYRGGNRYDLYFEPFSPRLPPAARRPGAELRRTVQRYVARVEHHVRGDPCNWFNWHDVWATNAADSDREVAGAAAVEGARLRRESSHVGGQWDIRQAATIDATGSSGRA